MLNIAIRDDCVCVLASQNSFILYFEGHSLLEKNKKVQAAFTKLWALHLGHLTWIKEIVPSYDSLLLEYDDLACDHHRVIEVLKEVLTTSSDTPLTERQVHHIIPVWYAADNAVGNAIEDVAGDNAVLSTDPANKHFESDLAEVANATSMTIQEVIKLHIQQRYRVYAVGFQPGFAYAGELDVRLALPRKATPRLKVPKGAVAIADKQTAVYPNQSPGGWHILGLCPIDMSLRAASEQSLKVGDTIQFESISKGQYQDLLINDDGT